MWWQIGVWQLTNHAEGIYSNSEVFAAMQRVLSTGVVLVRLALSIACSGQYAAEINITRMLLALRGVKLTD